MLEWHWRALQWPPADGRILFERRRREEEVGDSSFAPGALRIFHPGPPASEPRVDVKPVVDKLLLFYSDERVPHAVLSTGPNQERLAATFWFFDEKELKRTVASGARAKAEDLHAIDRGDGDACLKPPLTSITLGLQFEAPVLVASSDPSVGGGSQHCWFPDNGAVIGNQSVRAVVTNVRYRCDGGTGCPPPDPLPHPYETLISWDGSRSYAVAWSEPERARIGGFATRSDEHGRLIGAMLHEAFGRRAQLYWRELNRV